MAFLLRNFSLSKLQKDGKGMEGKRKIKNEHIVVKNPLFQELPTHEVTIKSALFRKRDNADVFNFYIYGED